MFSVRLLVNSGYSRFLIVWGRPQPRIVQRAAVQKMKMQQVHVTCKRHTLCTLARCH